MPRVAFDVKVHGPEILSNKKEQNRSHCVVSYMRGQARAMGLKGIPSDIIQMVMNYCQDPMGVYNYDSDDTSTHIYQDMDGLYFFLRDHDGRLHFDPGVHIHETKLTVLKPDLQALLFPQKKTIINIDVPFHKCEKTIYSPVTDKRHTGFLFEFFIIGLDDTLDINKFIEHANEPELRKSQSMKKIFRRLKTDEQYIGQGINKYDLPDCIWIHYSKGVTTADEVTFFNALGCNDHEILSDTRDCTEGEKDASIFVWIELEKAHNKTTIKMGECQITQLEMQKKKKYFGGIIAHSCTCKFWVKGKRAKGNRGGTLFYITYCVQ